MTSGLTAAQIRQDMLMAIRKYAGPVSASLGANHSEQWTVDGFVAEWDKTIGALIAAVQREDAEKIRAAHQDLPAESWAAKSAGAACANLIDPEMEARRVADRTARGEQP